MFSFYDWLRADEERARAMVDMGWGYAGGPLGMPKSYRDKFNPRAVQLGLLAYSLPPLRGSDEPMTPQKQMLKRIVDSRVRRGEAGLLGRIDV